MSFYRIHLLPAAHGDCILIEYGTPSRLNRVLIDGGTEGTWKRLEAVLGGLPEKERTLDLLVITHVDADHIGGALPLFDGGLTGLQFGDIWFNGYRHLSGLEEQGPVQGEKLTTRLWSRREHWNKAFGGKAVVVPLAGKLPAKTLPGGMKLTLLSPTVHGLQKLKPVWERECKRAGLDPQTVPPSPPEGLEPMGALDVEALAGTAFSEDNAEANGSSIAFVAEYDGRSALFGADAHPSVLAEAIARLSSGKLRVDAFKVPHHGSKNNVSAELLAKVETDRYLFSTNGAHFKHPDREAVARVIVQKVPGCRLDFNYRSTYTDIWESAQLRQTWNFCAMYPAPAGQGIFVEL